MLEKLSASHTQLFSQEEQWYYILQSIFQRFSRYEARAYYPQIGIFTPKIGDSHFISAILEGSPAEQAGLKRGDRIISADGKPFSPIRSFLTLALINQPATKDLQTVTLSVQRSPEQPPLLIQVVPVMKDAQDAFAEACKNSVKIITQDTKKIGYIHIWGGLIDDVPRTFEDGLVTLTKERCQGLILDLRDGIGGHSFRYFDAFSRSSFPEFGDGKTISGPPKWEKPVVLLINEGTRSGKEAFAYVMKKTKRAILVGTRTAGAVLGGKWFHLSDGGGLLIAAADSQIDGTRLEGVGVAPDMEVQSTLEYSAGKDPQLEKAIAVLREKLD